MGTRSRGKTAGGGAGGGCLAFAAWITQFARMDDEIGPPEGGCRTDNGHCFGKGGWDELTELATVQFHDGSIYRFGPISEATWVDEFLDTQQPGCSWNYFWKDKPPTRWEKLTAYPAGLIHEFHYP